MRDRRRGQEIQGERESMRQRARRRGQRELGSCGPIPPHPWSRGNTLVSLLQPLLRGPSAQTMAPPELALTAAPGGQGNVSPPAPPRAAAGMLTSTHPVLMPDASSPTGTRRGHGPHPQTPQTQPCLRHPSTLEQVEESWVQGTLLPCGHQGLETHSLESSVMFTHWF